MKDRTKGPWLPRRAAAVILMLLSTSPAWCPEAPVLERLRDALLRPSLTMSPEEMASLLARHEVRRLPADFLTIARAVDEAARRNGLPPELILAVILAESSFERHAISHRGAVGLMQLMPRTAEELATELEIAWTGESLLHEPRTNIHLGARYLRKMLSTFDELDRALAAYNRGPAATPPAGRPLPGGETAIFTRRVKAVLAQDDPLMPDRAFGDPHPFRLSSKLLL